MMKQTNFFLGAAVVAIFTGVMAWTDPAETDEQPSVRDALRAEYDIDKDGRLAESELHEGDEAVPAWSPSVPSVKPLEPPLSPIRLCPPESKSP